MANCDGCSRSLPHTHTQHRTQGHVLTVAVIVISFVLYECVGLCVCGWERATFFVALFRLLRWHLMKQKWHLCKSWRLVLQYFCCILQYFCVSQHNFKTRRMPKIYTHTQTQLWQCVCVCVWMCLCVCGYVWGWGASHVGSCLSKLTRRLCIEWKNVDNCAETPDVSATFPFPFGELFVQLAVWN